MKKSLVKSLILPACLLALTAAGCKGRGLKIDLKQASYTPAFEMSGMGGYKGKSVYISGITNNAANTSIWNYYSTTSNTYYEAWPSLQSYFWDCFVKAFNRIGVNVAADAANVPDFSLSFSSISAQELLFEVTLSRVGEAPFRKQYKVAAPPAQGVDPAALENRGYGQVDHAFAAIVSDPDFRRAFLGK
jgi:hypothetical protein